MRYYELYISDEIYEKVEQLRKKWNKEMETKYSFWDVIKLCIGTIWDIEMMNSLNKTLTNNSKT